MNHPDRRWTVSVLFSRSAGSDVGCSNWVHVMPDNCFVNRDKKCQLSRKIFAREKWRCPDIDREAFGAICSAISSDEKWHLPRRRTRIDQRSNERFNQKGNVRSSAVIRSKSNLVFDQSCSANYGGNCWCSSMRVRGRRNRQAFETFFCASVVVCRRCFSIPGKDWLVASWLSPLERDNVISDASKVGHWRIAYSCFIGLNSDLQWMTSPCSVVSEPNGRRTSEKKRKRKGENPPRGKEKEVRMNDVYFSAH